MKFLKRIIVATNNMIIPCHLIHQSNPIVKNDKYEYIEELIKESVDAIHTHYKGPVLKQKDILHRNFFRNKEQYDEAYKTFVKFARKIRK